MGARTTPFTASLLIKSVRTSSPVQIENTTKNDGATNVLNYYIYLHPKYVKMNFLVLSAYI